MQSFSGIINGEILFTERFLPLQHLSLYPVFRIQKCICNQFNLNPAIVEQMKWVEWHFFLFFTGRESFFYSFHVFFPESDLQKENPFYQISGGKRQEIQKQLKNRHIFIVDINVIAGGQFDFESIVLGSAGSASYMIYESGRAVDILVAVDFGTVTYVDIFQIGKMILIKIADLFKQFPAVDSGSGAGRE